MENVVNVFTIIGRQEQYVIIGITFCNRIYGLIIEEMLLADFAS